MKPDFIGGEGLDPIDLTSPEPEPETFSYSHHLIITGWCTKGKAESLEARIDNNTQIETRIQKIRAEKDKDDVLIVFDGNIDMIVIFQIIPVICGNFGFTVFWHILTTFIIFGSSTNCK